MQHLQAMTQRSYDELLKSPDLHRPSRVVAERPDVSGGGARRPARRGGPPRLVVIGRPGGSDHLGREPLLARPGRRSGPATRRPRPVVRARPARRPSPRSGPRFGPLRFAGLLAQEALEEPPRWAVCHHPGRPSSSANTSGSAVTGRMQRNGHAGSRSSPARTTDVSGGGATRRFSSTCHDPDARPATALRAAGRHPGQVGVAPQCVNFLVTASR